MKKLFKGLWILLGFVLIEERANGQEENAALWCKATQSSTYLEEVASRAIDSRWNSWTHTNSETDPWWRVDLMKVYRVNRVTITNRINLASRINGAVIRIGNYLDIYSNTICAVISSLASGAMATFSCGGMVGRYIVVHIPGDQKILSLSEVGVYGYLAGNRAVGGAATQSSTSGSWFAEKAIDSNRGLQQLYTGCSSTSSETNPWWRLDLLDVYRITKVVVTNRLDCCAEQINGAEIRIGNSLENNGSNNPICAVIPAIPAGESYSYSCDGMDGRYVIVYIPGDQKILTLCEVEVYGYLAENLAVDGVATQSSTSGDGFAEKAVDRGLQQLYTGCSSTLNETSPWWRLDLRHIYRVSKVVVTNRRDCCAEQINEAEIRIGNSLENNGSNNTICAVIPAIPAGESYNYSCGGMEGRYVNLIIAGDMKTLTLCEVKVYGEGPCLKRSFVKMQFNSSNDLTDPSMRENVLKQMDFENAVSERSSRDDKVREELLHVVSREVARLQLEKKQVIEVHISVQWQVGGAQLKQTLITIMLGSALADRGFTNVTLRWSQTPKRVIQKVNDAKRHCENRHFP